MRTTSKPTVSLGHQLAAFNAALLQRLPHAERQAVEDVVQRNKGVDIMAGVPKPGSPAPDFALPDEHGRILRLSDRLARGPAVLLFVRGGWCPFCTMTLRAYQDYLPAFHEYGADLLAVTPQTTRSCSAIVERDLLAFPTLSDQGNHVARQYGIDTELERELRPMHLRLNHDLPRLNGTGNWSIPQPATFVIGGDGLIKLSHVAPTVYGRLDPAEALAAVQALPAHQDVDA